MITPTAHRDTRLFLPTRVWRSAACCLCLFVLLGACKKDDGADEEDLAEVLRSQADALLEAGDAEGALVVLARLDVQNDVPARRMLAEARAMTGDFHGAHEVISTLPEDEETARLRDDTCVVGAMIALEEPSAELAELAELADALMLPCADSERIDLQALRLHPIRPPTQLSDLEPFRQVIREIAQHEHGPEVDTAADWIELRLWGMVDEGLPAHLEMETLAVAFSVGQSEELRERIVERVFELATPLVEDDPHSAATIAEYVYLGRVPGLEPPEEAVHRATRLAKVALSPIFAANFVARYDRKFGDEDREAGIISPQPLGATRAEREGVTVTFRGADREARLEAARSWVYRSFERPRPTPSPDVFARIDQCNDDGPDPCVVPIEVMIDFIYFLDEHEQATAEALGEALEWPRGD